MSGASSNLQTQLDKISVNTMKKMTTKLYNVASGQNNLNNSTTGAYNVAIGCDAMNYSVNSYNSICIGSGAGYNISASDNICIGTNTGTDTVNGYSRSVCIGYGSKISQSNQISLGTADSTVNILGSVSTGSMVLSNQSLGYLSGTTSNILGQIGAISDNSTLALSKTTSIQSSVKIIGDNIDDLFSRTDGQLTGTGLTISNNTVSVQGQLKQNSSGFNVGYYTLAGCSDVVTYNFGTDYGVYMISFSVNGDRYWTLSSYVHVLRTVSNGSFIIPLFQGSNDMNQSIDTGTNIYTINCSNRGGSLKIMKLNSY